MPKSKSSEQTTIPAQLLVESFLEYAGALIVVLDKSGRIELFNKACEKLTGLSFSEVKNKFPWDVVLPPEDAQIIRENAFDIFANKPKSLSGSYTNYWLTKNDGRALIDWINTVVLDESGHMKNLVSVGTDVTEARRNEEILKYNETRLNEAQRIAKVGSWELDLLNNVLIWTDEIFNLFEIEQSEFGASYDAFINAIHPDDREMVNQAYTESLSNRAPYEIVHRLKMTDGRVKTVREICESFFDDDGKPLRSVGTVQDISELHNVEMELKQYRDHLEETVVERTADMEKARDDAERANNAKSEFLSRMSHELRTPMNAILGFSQILDIDKSLNQSQHSSVGEILMAGNHLLELINEVLDLSQIESGTIELTLAPVNICHVIDDSVSLIEPLLKERNIKIVWDGENQTQHIIQAEKIRLKQIFINLLSNAVKYNAENGKITINFVKHNDYLRINIIDTGPGLSHEQQKQIFKPFNRAGAEVTSVEGVGIGLTISKQLVELMNGEIGIESSVGNGCCFYIEFKLIEIDM